MPMALTLYGYRPSVYLRVARLVLAEKGVAYDQKEVNPFAPGPTADYLSLHPFNRVPTLVHDGFVLYETGAITRYVDRTFPGPRLQPVDRRYLARMDQAISIVDSYVYWPLVRQVYVHAVGRPRAGQAGDAAEIDRGLTAATKALVALESLKGDAAFLAGPVVSLADLHLLPMITYFVQAPEGAALLDRHTGLANWWRNMVARPSFAATEPQ